VLPGTVVKVSAYAGTGKTTIPSLLSLSSSSLPLIFLSPSHLPLSLSSTSLPLIFLSPSHMQELARLLQCCRWRGGGFARMIKAVMCCR
jgi:hypothetical protein